MSTTDPDRLARFHAFSQAKYGGLLDDWIHASPALILSCQTCGHSWYQNQPEPEQLSQMYAAGKPLGVAGLQSLDPSAAMLQKMAVLRRMLGRRPGSPTLLDYGSGSGRWARAAMQAGFKVTAFEPSTERSHSAAAPFAVVHSLADLRDQRFATIQLEQVLEHVPDPLEVLLALKSFCEPDALLRITVPNLWRSPEGRDLWKAWPFDGKTPHTLAPFEHLHGFTPRSLDRLLQRAGYSSIAAWQEWRWQPVNSLRGLAGRWIPSVATTLRFVTCR